ncbi:HK97 family phage prohead protease [Xanthomonas axonopodis]|uniref:HK97 family phage prohead protease n=1 Tax=Xanthomonas axonopodis TaxID=53413 RepID=UPI003558D8D4
MDIERRFATGATVEGRQLIGLAAPFGTETRIADFRELIAPGAFTRTLAENKDILALADHGFYPDITDGCKRAATF